MIQLERILVPTDFSDHSKQAAEYANELANRFNAQVHVLHVIESPIRAMPSPGAPLPDSLLTSLEEDAKKEIKNWAETQFKDVESVEQTIKHGTPFVEIVRYAKDNEIDAIVIGTHGRSGLKHALIGSVAERVVRKASCPVLTVRPQGHQFVMP